MRIYLWIMDGCKETWHFLRRHWVIASVLGIFAAAIVQTSSGFFGLAGQSLYSYLQDWSSTVFRSAEIRAERDQLRIEVADLKRKIEAQPDINSSYLVIPNRGLKHCREIIRKWAQSEGYKFADKGKSQHNIFSISKENEHSWGRCVGANSSPDSFVFLFSTPENDDFRTNVFERLGATLAPMIRREEVLWPSKPPLEFPEDSWRQPYIYSYYIELTLSKETIEYSEWDQKDGILTVMKQFVPELTTNIKCGYDDILGMRQCSFLLPRASGAVMLPTADEADEEYTILVAIATQMYGEDDAWSVSKTFLGDDIDRYLVSRFSAKASERSGKTW